MEKQNANNVENNIGGHFEHGIEESDVVNEPITLQNLEAARDNKIAGRDEKILGKLGIRDAHAEDYERLPSRYEVFRWEKPSALTAKILGTTEISALSLNEEDQQLCQDLLTKGHEPEVQNLGLIDSSFDLGETDSDVSHKEVDIRPGARNGGKFKDEDLNWLDEDGNPIPHSDIGPLGDHRANP